MTIFILVSILLVAALAIALLMGVSPASQKVKVWAMYVGAALMLVVALVVCDYIDALPDFPSKFRFHAVLVLTVTVGYLCIAIACMEKYNVLKRKNRVLEEALTEKEQEKVSILMERQNEQQQALQKGELEWFAGKIKMFSEEEQKAILASAYAFAEHDLVLPPSITVQPNEMCSQQELMYYVYSAFFSMGKKHSEIISFLSQVFPLYFLVGESVLAKKMPGLEKVRKRRTKEEIENSDYNNTSLLFYLPVDVPVFFADLYCAWQKRAIENGNKLVRQYIKKERISARSLTGKLPKSGRKSMPGQEKNSIS